ncbi:MAG: hypothetical protein Q8O34_16660 [Rhodocyclaceae bacterium]|nr:hypothetical protein [Rhodocyclaceae bacterium]
MIRIEIAGQDAIEKHLAGLPVKLETRVLHEMSQIIYDQAQRGADKHTKTGALLQSLYNRPIPGGRKIGHNPQRAPHAVFVHWGTRPHVIRPKNRKVLRWPSGGAFAFARKVNHPGYKGDPWLHQAANEAIRQFDAIVNRALKGL